AAAVASRASGADEAAAAAPASIFVPPPPCECKKGGQPAHPPQNSRFHDAPATQFRRACPDGGASPVESRRQSGQGRSIARLLGSFLLARASRVGQIPLQSSAAVAVRSGSRSTWDGASRVL